MKLFKVRASDDPKFVYATSEDFDVDRFFQDMQSSEASFGLSAGVFSDYPANNLGWPLCSDHLKSVLQNSLGPDDNVAWRSVLVQTLEGTALAFWVILFPEPSDLLNYDASKYIGDSLAVPVFARDKIRGHRVIHCPGSTSTFVVSEEVVGALHDHGCVGLDFVPISLR